jgi:cytochrome bd-type quinol oxidase subunit 1
MSPNLKRESSEEFCDSLLGGGYVEKRRPESTWFYRAPVLAGPPSVMALIAGWIVTEVGRQPWVVLRGDAAREQSEP